MMSEVSQLWSHLVTWLSGHAVEPMLAFLHAGNAFGAPQEIAEAAMIAFLQIGIISLIFRPL